MKYNVCFFYFSSHIEKRASCARIYMNPTPQFDYFLNKRARIRSLGIFYLAARCTRNRSAYKNYRIALCRLLRDSRRVRGILYTINDGCVCVYVCVARIYRLKSERGCIRYARSTLLYKGEIIFIATLTQYIHIYNI